jgi:hypothetical protein
MRNLQKIVLLTSSIWILATPALADWQFTKWGMTKEDLQKLAPISLNSGSSCPVNNSNSPGGLYKVEFTSDWKVGDMNFTACYLFLNDRLHIVNLFSQDVNSEAIIRGLSQRYGTPEIKKTSFDTSYIWDRRDEEISFFIRPDLNYQYVVGYRSKAGSNEISVREGL